MVSIAFFGTPDFAVPTLRALHDSQHLIVGVVTQPDRPRDRGHRLHPSPVKEFARAHDLPLLQPLRLRDEAFLRALRDLRADLGVVAAYGKILTDAVLESPSRGFINVHASLLPKYRGAAPIHRAILAGESETGVTIMRVVQELDAGPTISSATRPIGPDETSADVEGGLAVLGARLLVDAVDAIENGRAIETPQDDARATFAKKIDKADGAIDWSVSARTIHNQVRGLHPWPHAYADLDGERIIILAAQVPPDASGSPGVEPGTIVRADGEELAVQTGDGIIRLMTLQREGRRPMSARDFIAGGRVATGARFRPFQRLQ